MKEISVESFARDPETFFHLAQAERLLLTRNGSQLVVLMGVENKDREDWDLEQSSEFWRMIDERRGRPTVPLEELKASILSQE